MLKGKPINKQKSVKLQELSVLKKEYDCSFPNHKKAWRNLVSAAEYVGWKDLCNMLMMLQEKTNDSKVYRIKIINH